MDNIDNKLLLQMQADATLSQRELAEWVGLSQNACWRRLQKLTEQGVLQGRRAVIAPEAMGLDLTVFVMLRTRHHDDKWSARFRSRVEAILEITDFWRIGGEWDYMLKLVTTSMAGYDGVYKRLIEGLDLERVTGIFTMETIFDGRPLRPPIGG